MMTGQYINASRRTNKMAMLKQSRWVKVHEPGQGQYDEHDNIMDILIGEGRCRAEATYTVRSYKKAGYWLVEYLKCAEAEQLVAEAADFIQQAVEQAGREDPEVKANGDTWSCNIEKLSDGSFKVQMSWAVNEPVTRKPTAKEARKAAKTAAKKKRTTKKKAKTEAPTTEAPAESMEAAV